MQAKNVDDPFLRSEAVAQEFRYACRSCGTELGKPVLDLGMQPLSNAYVHTAQLGEMEAFYPLRVRLCAACALVQADAVTMRETIFNDDYAYFSSFSQSWLDHAKCYAETMIAELALPADAFIVEIASNDGYLLRWFAERGLRVRGIDPAGACARAAALVGVPTDVAFFGVDTARAIAREHGRAQLIAANNVLAHVPDLNDFAGGITELLAPGGTATFEFPHVLELLRTAAFDTIYHEHYSYLSIQALAPLFARHELHIVKVAKLSTHGGSVRVFVRHAAEGAADPSVAAILAEEAAANVGSPEPYRALAATIDATRLELLQTLIELRRDGKIAVAYGAAAKGNTLLNTFGIRADLLAFVVDRSPAKIGRFMPGSHVPIVDQATLDRVKPDWILILPWNLSDEIAAQLAHARGWGAKLFRPVPRLLEVFDSQSTST